MSGVHFTSTEDGRSLTMRAYDRRVEGATSGAGTDVCARCGFAKETTRLNSDQCSACRSGVRGGPVTVPVTLSHSEHREFIDACERDDLNPADVLYVLVNSWLHRRR